MACLSTAILILAIRSPGWIVVSLAPLLVVTAVGWHFWRTRAPRWPTAAPALYLLLAFAGYFAIGLA